MSGMLTEKQMDLVNYIEQTWLLDGAIPTRDVCIKHGICSKDFYDKAYASQEFREQLALRGVNLSSTDSLALSPEQLAVANVLLDRYDNRSRKKKLIDMGISTQTLNGWMRDPAFREYYTRRAETQFGDAMPDVITAHIDQAEKGDMKAVQLYYEMMGRYSPRQINVDINVEAVMIRVLEAIQKHVTDPNQIIAIAEELSELAAPPKPQPNVYEPPKEIKALSITDMTL